MGETEARESSSLPEVTQLMGIAETDQVANPGGGPSAALRPPPPTPGTLFSGPLILLSRT